MIYIEYIERDRFKEPIFTIILAAILLGERLSSLQLADAGMVIAGIIWITGRIRYAGN